MVRTTLHQKNSKLSLDQLEKSVATPNASIPPKGADKYKVGDGRPTIKWKKY